jgi:hypothetical protein
MPLGLDVLITGQSELANVVGTVNPPSGLPRTLNRGEKQRDQNRDDRHHSEQLYEGEGVARRSAGTRTGG